MFTCWRLFSLQLTVWQKGITETNMWGVRSDTLDKMCLIRSGINVQPCSPLTLSEIHLFSGQGGALLRASYNQYKLGWTEHGGVADSKDALLAQRSIIKVEATCLGINKPQKSHGAIMLCFTVCPKAGLLFRGGLWSRDSLCLLFYYWHEW